jgi:glycosyltransferase involved in cell wall biosynthesis
VPGCRTLVRDGVEGVLVPPNDAAALAAALTALAGNPVRVARMGEAARTRVLDGFTEQDVMGAVRRLYSSMLAA